VAEPELVAAEPELVAAEPELVAAEPELVAAEPELVAAEPELGAAEPELGAVEPVLKSATPPGARPARPTHKYSARHKQPCLRAHTARSGASFAASAHVVLWPDGHCRCRG